MTTVKDILVEARDLLAQPYRWTKGDFVRVRTFKGERIACFCLSGALRKAAGGVVIAEDRYVSTPMPREGGDALFKAIELLGDYISSKSYLGSGRIVNFNDKKSTQKKDVLALLDKAIASVE